MPEIERETRANAIEIKKATGSAPGGRTSGQRVVNERSSVSAATDPGQGGAWSAVQNTPVVPVFQAVLPNGKVLIWDSVGDQSVDTYPDHTFTRAVVWDPATNTSKQVNVSGYNIFCAGFAQLADGRVLVAGGNLGPAMEGIVQTHIFDWRTESWTRGPDMDSERWYPSVAALGNGEALIVGGGPDTAEVFRVDSTLRRLTGFPSFGRRVYPFLVPRPNGRVELVGPYDKMDTMSTSGSGALVATRNRDGIDRTAGSFVTYDIGKVLVAGGGSVTEGGKTSVPTKTASVVDVSGSGTSVRATTSMSVGRRQFNLTALADGSVLATGGQSSAVNGLVDLANPVFAAERWDPATETWTVLSSASRVRQYHSVASLLPDGRVLTGGGGICGTCTTQGYLEKNVEYFTPPYLYKKDGSGDLADRPVIDSAPGVGGYARTLEIATDEAGSIDKVGLVRLGAPTHGDDQGQRYVPLDFTASGSALSVTTPATPHVAPPGYYMLFITDDEGVPSVAEIVKLETDRQPRATSVRSDYNGDGKSDRAVWRPTTGDGWSAAPPRRPGVCQETSRCRRTSTVTVTPTSPYGGPRPGVGMSRPRRSCRGESTGMFRSPRTSTVTATQTTPYGGPRRDSGGSGGSARPHGVCGETSRCRRTSTVTVTPTSRFGGPRPGGGTSGARLRCSGESTRMFRCRRTSTGTVTPTLRCGGPRPASGTCGGQAR